tara:strand:- start:348 stop:3068 length:2721 start_codon:yes stop_codon:yes gene_type:complete
MPNTKVNISLQGKSDPTINITTLSGGFVDAGANIVPAISFVNIGSQGPAGPAGANGSSATIDNNSITQSHLADNSVGGAQIINGSVSYNELGVASVRGNRIMQGTISTIRLADNAVTGNKLANNSVGPEHIIDGTITKELLQDLAIDSDKIEDLTIQTGKLQDLIITTIKIRDRNVTGAKICSNPDLDGEVKCHKMKIKGMSPGLITGPDADALHIKSNTTIDFLNSSGSTIASLDQSGNLTILGTIDGRDIAADGVKLDGISDSEIIDWSVAQTENIHTSNYTDTNTQLPFIDEDNMASNSSSHVPSQQSVKSYVDDQVAGIVDSAPSTLNTLNELANSLGDDANFSTTITNNIATKAPIASPTFTGTIAIPNIANIETAITANTAKVSFPGLGTTSTTALAGDTALLQLGTTSTTALAGDTTTISGTQASAITSNTAKTGITTSQANAITANTAKPDLTVDGAGTVHANNYTDTQYSVMGSGNSYAAGLVKAGGILHLGAFLRKDGSWAIPPDTNTTYSEATSSAEGLMSTAHHDKLDGITAGADVTTVTTSTTNADYPVVFHNSNALLDDGASDFTYNPSTNNLKIGKLTANTSGSTLAGIVSVGTTDGDDRLYIARYRDTSTIYPFAHIYAGLDGLTSKCGFKIVVRNNSGGLADGLKIDGNTKEVTFSGVINGTKLNTGQGDNELYAMNQNVQTTNSVTFASVTTTGDIQVSGNDIKDSGGNAAITFGGTGTVTIPSGDLTVSNHATVSKTLTIGGAGATAPAVTIRTAKITLSTADCNALHTTPITLVSAAGADTVIVPVSGMIRVDRAATQTNSSADLNMHYSGTSGAYFNSSLVHLRRFMWNETGDRVFNISPLAIERSQSLTEDVNASLVVSVDSALTNNCFTSVTIFLTYHVFDIS